MATSFPGYSKKGLAWLRGIAKNNERDWFMERKPIFESEIKGATETLVEAINDKLEKIAPAYIADPKKALGRIYRDTRFSKDKTPYKTYMSAKFSRAGGAKEECAGYWLKVDAKGVDILGGSYSPGSPQLLALREHIAGNQKAFEALLKRKPLRDAMGELQGEKLKNVPRGFDKEHPAGDLLKFKQFYLVAHLPIAAATSPDLVKEVTRRFKLMKPFVEFLDAGLGS